MKSNACEESTRLPGATLMMQFRDEADSSDASEAPRPSIFAQLLIDSEEDRTLRAVLVGVLRETER
jgi:hypothetical protein